MAVNANAIRFDPGVAASRGTRTLARKILGKHDRERLFKRCNGQFKMAHQHLSYAAQQQQQLIHAWCDATFDRQRVVVEPFVESVERLTFWL